LMQQLNSDNHNRLLIPFQVIGRDLRWGSKGRTKKRRETDGCGKSRGQYVWRLELRNCALIYILYMYIYLQSDNWSPYFCCSSTSVTNVGNFAI
jgi:hypothetical protein